MKKIAKWILRQGTSEIDLARQKNIARLQTIPFSHFCELARWSLEHNCVEFEESPSLPGLSGARVRMVRGTQHISSDGSFPGQHTGRNENHARQSAVPCLILPNGEVIRNSWDIFEYAFEENNVHTVDVKFLKMLDQDFAPATRIIAYHHILNSNQSWRKLITNCGGYTDRFLYLLAGQGNVQEMLRNVMSINENSCKQAIEIVRDIFHIQSDQIVRRVEASTGTGGGGPALKRSVSFTSITPEDMVKALYLQFVLIRLHTHTHIKYYRHLHL